MYYEAMIKVERHGSVLRVSLNRPEVRNALNDELINAVYEVFATVSKEIRAIVLSGEGAAFCAGGDLEWMKKAAGYSVEENKADAMRIAKMFAAIRDCHAVSIASVHGYAMGGGAGIISACDVAIATEDSKFAFSEVKLGLIPATISPFVIDKIGKGHARALFATGEIFDANHALRIGLVNEVVSAREKESAITKKLRAILSAGPNAIYGAKKLVIDAPLSTEETATRLAETRASEEGTAGIQAFLNKQAPPFVENVIVE
jgi:methylglutaconyl-CoA hydratase